MDTSLAHENARLRALLQTQQDTIRQMAEYNRLLSQRVAAYASEINRLKALVAKLQHTVYWFLKKPVHKTVNRLECLYSYQVTLIPTTPCSGFSMSSPLV